jgi:hypothetical protein
MKNLCLSFLAIALLLPGAALAAAGKPMPTRLQGTVVSLTASSITIATSHGNETVALGPKLRVLDLSKSSLDKVRNNSFIGTTVVPQPDGTYKSTEVHIFAEALRGMGEGFTKMNPSGSRMMANAAVHVPVNMMANAAVQGMKSSGGGKTISMTFPGRKITIHIPQNVPVSYISPASRSLPARGKTVLLFANGAPGKLATNTIVVIEPGASLPQ